MNQSRKSNEERAVWRAKCRKRLSDHLSKFTLLRLSKLLMLEAEQNLGLSIPYEEVRLITGADDPYRWSGLPGTEHLFTKQLSKHCLRTYMEIFNGVGNSFEALPNDAVDVGEPSSAHKHGMTTSDVNLSVKVSPLKSDRFCLT
jgi:hypothetical protein